MRGVGEVPLNEEEHSFAAISYIPNQKVNETTIVDSPGLPPSTSPIVARESRVSANICATTTNNRYANDYDEDDLDDEVAQVIDGVMLREHHQHEADVESSRGSAWPSETSRLTPHQSNY